MEKLEFYQKINAVAEKYAAMGAGYDEGKAFKELERDFLWWLENVSQDYTGTTPMSHYIYTHRDNAFLEQIHSVDIIYHAVRWLDSKVLFSFNAELEKEIIDSRLSPTMEIPAVLLNRCPYGSFFVQTNGSKEVEPDVERIDDEDLSMLHDEIGYFVTISPYYRWDAEKKRLVLTEDKVMDVASCTPNMIGSKETHFIYVSMRIPKENSCETIDDVIIQPLFKDTELGEDLRSPETVRKYGRCILLRALQYILHLCSENSIIQARETKKAPSWASKKKKSAQKVKVYDVSLPTERSFSSAGPHYVSKGREESTGKTKSPHTRRAHWAYRWVGSREEKHMELRWIREARIHAEEDVRGAVVSVDLTLQS